MNPADFEKFIKAGKQGEVIHGTFAAGPAPKITLADLKALMASMPVNTSPDYIIEHGNECLKYFGVPHGFIPYRKHCAFVCARTSEGLLADPKFHSPALSSIIHPQPGELLGYSLIILSESERADLLLKLAPYLRG